VLVAAGRHVALHHADGMLRQQAAVIAGALPVAVGDLRDDLAPFLYGFENETDVELTANRGLDADLYVVEVDEDGNPGTACFCRIHASGPTGPEATASGRRAVLEVERGRRAGAGRSGWTGRQRSR